MKKNISLFIIGYLFLNLVKTFGQVGIGTITPKNDAILDVESSSKGILIPRVNLTNLFTLSPINSLSQLGTESLLVYNTNSSTGKGFFYWNGVDMWIPVGKSTLHGLQFFSFNFTPNVPNAPDFDFLANRTVASRSGIYSNSLNITNEDFLDLGLTPANNTSSDGFAVKLIGYYTVTTPGDFTINSTSDDGVRIYVDDCLVLIDWEDSANNITTGTVNLAKGKHKFEFWFFENEGQQKLNFEWGQNPDGYTGSIHALQFTID